jgi:hypothetical protein
MISEHRVADQAGGTYGSSEAAAGWQRSSVARAQILAPLTERMLDLASFLPLFALARMVPAQGCVSKLPLNRSPATALTVVAA